MFSPVVARGIGTSFAKRLLLQVGSLRTTAQRVGCSAALLLLIWWPLSASDAMPIGLERVALKRLPHEPFGIMTRLGPAGAALLGVRILGERLQRLVMGLVMAGAAGRSVTARQGPDGGTLQPRNGS